MTKPHFTWPLYLAITFGVVAAVDLIFDLIRFGKATLGGIVFFAVALILLDGLTGDTPSQGRSGEKS